MPAFRIPCLPSEDVAHLREIVDHGTLTGDADVLRMVKFLASALLVVQQGQKETPEMVQKVLDELGLGR